MNAFLPTIRTKKESGNKVPTSRILKILLLFLLINSYPGGELVCAIPSLTKTEAEESITRLLEKSDSYIYENFDSAHFFADSAFAVAEKHHNVRGKVRALRKHGLIYYFEVNFTEAFKILMESNRLALSINDKKGQLDALNLIASIYSDQEKYPESFAIYDKMLKLVDSTDYYNLSRIYNNMGVNYMELGKLEKCKEYYLHAYSFGKKNGDKQYESQHANNIGIVYLKLNQADSAYLFFKRGMKLANEVNDKQRLANSYESFGNYYYQKGDYQKALENYQKAHAYCLDIQVVYEISNTAAGLSKTYKALGDYENAYNYLQLQKAMDDSINTKEIASYITQFELEETFNKERELSEAIHAKEKLRKNFFAILSIAIIAIAGVLLFSYTQKRKSYRLLKEQMNKVHLQKEEIQTQAEQLAENNAVKDKLFSVISHDLRGPLHSLIGILELAKEGVLTEKDFKENLGHMLSSAQNIGALTENLLNWARSQQGGLNLESEKIDLYKLSNNTIKHLKSVSDLKKLTIQNMVDTNHFLKADLNSVSIILRNLISNAIKFSHDGGNIFIRSFVDSGFINCQVEDEGIGMDTEKTKQLFHLPVTSSNGTSNEKGAGLGLLLTSEFVKLNGGTIQINSTPGRGSTFTFSLPKYQPA